MYLSKTYVITLIQLAILILFIHILSITSISSALSASSATATSSDSSDTSSISLLETTTSTNSKPSISISKDSWLTSLSLGISNPQFSSENGKVTVGENRYFYSGRFQTDLPLFKIFHIHGEVMGSAAIGDPVLSKYKSIEQNSYRGLIGIIFKDITPKWNLIPRAGVFVAKRGDFRKGNIQEAFPQISPLWLYQRDNGQIVNLSINYTHIDNSKKTIELPGLHTEWALGAEAGQIIPLNKRRNIAFHYSVITNIYNYYRTPENTFVKRFELIALMGLTI
ncbi:MAG: hypothetical protein HQK49_01365 [Oligoflexia bacterium]|nr:hypothetical protein [Oligoflexia bacterium]